MKNISSCVFNFILRFKITIVTMIFLLIIFLENVYEVNVVLISTFFPSSLIVFLKPLFIIFQFIFIGALVCLPIYLLLIFIKNTNFEKSEFRTPTIKLKKNIKNSKNINYGDFKLDSPKGFWNGHKGLALTFWGYFFGGNILFNVLTLIFGNNPTLIMIILIFYIVWIVLSAMGVFNAAEIYKAEKIKQGLPYTMATTAKVAVVLLILSGIGNSIPR
jgi:hypothetical protein